MNVVNVRFIGGPYDGLAQGWNVDGELPDQLRMSSELGHSRGGIKMEMTSGSACGMLAEGESATDETIYVQLEPGTYYHRGPALAEA